MRTCYFSLLVFFSVISPVLSAQVSKKQADSIIQEYVRKEITNYYWLYSNENIIANKNGVTIISNRNNESISINSLCFVYFIDEHPYANWAHPCRYIFVDKSNGKIYEKESKTPPENLEIWEMITPLPKIENTVKFDFLKNKLSMQPDSIDSQNCYAIIISGGYDMYNNWERYWNDCSAIYSTLINVYGYLKGHIYVLISDGTNPAIDRHLNNGSYDSSPLDLDGDGYPDIQYSATKNSITTVFDTLANILTPDDHLFIFTTDHGNTTSSGEATLELWYETITASEFAIEVEKVNSGNVNIVMEQCFSGGFIPHLEKQGRTIATACLSTEYSWAMPPDYVYNEFVYHWTAAVAGCTPYGSSVNADYNNDGYVSIKEAFDYANTNDTQMETPQYSSIDSTLGDRLTLFGFVCSLINFVNQTINDTLTVEGCVVNVNNVTLAGGADVTISGSRRVEITSLQMEDGSSLIVNNGVAATQSSASPLMASRAVTEETLVEAAENVEESTINTTPGNGCACLYQNRPNPFTGKTTIGYYLPKDSGPARLRITDMNGITVKTVGITASGEGTVVLDADALPKGIYLYSLIINGRVAETRRMVLE